MSSPFSVSGGPGVRARSALLRVLIVPLLTGFQLLFLLAGFMPMWKPGQIRQPLIRKLPNANKEADAKIWTSKLDVEYLHIDVIAPAVTNVEWSAPGADDSETSLLSDSQANKTFWNVIRSTSFGM
eukprot:CAMPEP_0177246036 /NCGR_PEP_ID=MMETSP0367-20130122/50788_1 /TAXON_ID=447022 ORGANISM="Scrippsiella hangoei-like, Strain SHHI-4" /NCGR_SAMPLE_ID=MMETSP0367 /ASSEMBLY_ACC=CAM_ASM_000362 /LENGTH=125 /DNA_ID=CAMNT_0018698015 /DNA_START=592 /DNA_END=970 /DNA_ORIENTATION=+